jgi:hypothetical protein
MWESGGPEGAIFVDDATAWKIINDLPSKFFLAAEPVKATSKTQKVEAKAEETPVEEEAPVAVEAAPTTKRRSTKE